MRLAGAADSRGLDGFFRAERSIANLRVGSLFSLRLSEAPVADAIAIPYAARYGGGQVYRVREGRLEAVAVEVIGEQVEAGAPPRLLIRAAALRAGDVLAASHLPNAISGLKVQTGTP